MRERQYRPTTSDLLDGILVFVHNVKDFLHFFPPFPPFFTIHRRKGAHLGWTAGQFGATWDSFNKTDEELRFSLYFCASTHGTLCVSSSNLCYRNGIDSLLLLCLSWAVRSCRSLFWIIPGTGLIQSGGPPCQVAPFSLHSFLTNTIKANLLGCIYLYPIGNYRHLAMPPPSPQPPTLTGPPSLPTRHTHTQTIFFSGLVCLIAETTSSWLPHFLPFFFVCVYLIRLSFSF